MARKRKAPDDFDSGETVYVFPAGFDGSRIGQEVERLFGREAAPEKKRPRKVFTGQKGGGEGG
jgi:hypothetical protein